MSKNLLQNRIRLAEYDRLIYSVTPEPGVPIEEILKPEYWAHVAKQFQPGTRLEVTPEDRSWFAELYVRSNTNNSVSVAVLRHIKFDSAPKPAADNGEPYEIKHRGGAGWSVIRKSDKVPVFEKGQSKLDAERWVEEQTELA